MISFQFLAYFLLIILIYNNQINGTSGQNVDTKSPSVFWMKAYQKDHSSMFGHSVLMHDSDEFGPIILIGAPNYTDYISTSNGPVLDNLGEIFHCSIPLKGTFNSKIGCQEIDLHEKLKLYDPTLFTQDMHYGWNLIPRQKTEEFLTCSYSRTQNLPLMNEERRMETWKVPNGVCFLFSEDNFSKNKNKDSRLKLIFPMHGEEQFINGVYLRAYGMAGFSADFSSDEEVVYMGAPGYDNWKGGVASVNLSKYPSFRTRVDYDIEVLSWKDMEKDVYLGYSMTNGKYFKDYPEFIVLGAPRRNLTGSIFLFPSNTPSVWEIKNDPLLIMINGDQVGEYFGYSLLTLDVNQDGYDDLLVSAPMYSSYQSDYSDEGRVYFYASTGDKKRGFHESILLHGDSKPLARFGTAMADLGDINKDGFKDVVIGAPYEDDFKGTIYIYRGTPQGIRDKYHQRISSAEHFTSIGLRGFGCDFSANVDIDSNSYPDIMIGAYLSTNALLLRTRPIIQILPSIQLNKDYVDLNESCSFEDEDFGNVFEKPLACVRLKYCFQITSHNDEYSPKVSLMATLKLDREFNRAFVIVVDRRFNDQNGQSRYSLARVLNQQFLLVPNKINYCSNYYLIYFKEMSKIDNLIDPIKFDLDYSIDTSDFKVNDPQEKFHVPILDDETTTNITTDVYLKLCKNTAKDCIANLSLKPSFYFDDEPNPKFYPPKSLNELVEGEYRLITLNVQVINSGELAFKTILTIRTEKNVSVVQFDRRCQKVNDKKSEFLIFDCQLMDQLFEIDTVNLTFNLFNVAETEIVHFRMEISHYNQQSIMNETIKYEVAFKTIKKSEINLKVIPNDSNVKRYPSHWKILPKSESMIQIERFGPSSIDEIVLNFIYPNSYNQHEIINNVQVKRIDNSIKLECDQPRILQIGQDNSQPISIYSNNDLGKRLINLNCSNSKIICHVMKCRFGPLKIMPNNKKHIAEGGKNYGSIYLRLNINENISSIQKKFNQYKFTNLTISIDLNASINDAASVQSGLIKHDQIVLNWIPIYAKDSGQIKWGIIIGTIVGIILLALIILCCYWFNFFKRNELLQAELINSNDGYD